MNLLNRIKPKYFMVIITSLKRRWRNFSLVKKELNGAIDSEGHAIYILYEPIWSGLVSLKKRGVKIRTVTEITLGNIHYCKKLMKVGELRYLDGIRTNFGISDGKQVMLHGVSKEKDPLSQAISN